jgi:hypothetical protein
MLRRMWFLFREGCGLILLAFLAALVWVCNKLRFP